MCRSVKYGTWVIGEPEAQSVKCLREAGFGELTANVLSSRGFRTPQEAQALLSSDQPLIDPFEMKEMDRAVAAVRAAMAQQLPIAVFGDYDVDGITATCLLTDYLRSCGASCTCHIPGRLEEGYGLNAAAIEALAKQGVKLIVTVDCGITALEEAALCRRLGITLVITDHHECKAELPDAAAVLDPHRPDRTYPHTDLSGVGVAFKLASALSGDQDAMARRYCDLFCLGTIADVMPLRGENRRLTVMGLKELQAPHRLGLRALIRACECGSQPITAATIGYVLAPRINAAGRMEHAELGVRLFLSQDEAEADALSETLCRLNRERQATETEIYREVTARLRSSRKKDSAIVLAGENWHQGVIGIVASRLCEEYCRPTFLICLNGEHGKASSRSYGGFNLFRSLEELSGLLEGYGGHEFAAGFTISRQNIDEFRRGICRRAEDYLASGQGAPTLHIDCELPAALFTTESVAALSQLEPCSSGCPKPVFCLSELIVERMSTVANGKHLRLTLRDRDGTQLQSIFFSGGSMQRTLHVGDRVDIAFHAQINEYRDRHAVQLTVLDLRKTSPTALYDRFAAHGEMTEREWRALAPDRSDIADVWRYLRRAVGKDGQLRCDIGELCQSVTELYERHSMRRTLACLAVLADLHFISVARDRYRLQVRLFPDYTPNPLENSALYHELHRQ